MAKPTPTRPETHAVQKGETLYSIARQYGISHYELGLWNNIQNVNAIREGQQLRLSPPASGGTQITVIALKDEPAVPAGMALDEDKISGAGALTGNAADSASDVKVPQLPVKSEPKAVKVPYSDQTWAQYQASAPKPDTADTKAQSFGDKVDRKSGTPELNGRSTGDNENLQWIWPANGKIGSVFSDSTKGLVITGTLGQPIYASADGQVSYIGNSLRGYGKMVVIKHNKTYLSVYAHNSLILVREGQNVTRGQKIAEMGNSDSDGGAVKLHFEIRRLGKPVDPMKYLPSERPS